MILTNPIECQAPIATIFEGQRIEIKPGQTVNIEDDNLAKYLMGIYGFLERIKEEDVETATINKFICPICGLECKNKLGLASHLRKCQKDHPDAKIDKDKPLIETLKPAGFVSNPKSRSQLEDEGFVGTDIPGRLGKDNIGGRMETVTIDHDGVSWYGEGIADDVGFSASLAKKSGKF
jgi:hypothetical protein